MTISSLNDQARLHLWVTGRVQGVGFRAFVQQSASWFGLTGWVRNVGYDQVETVVEGPRAALEQFMQAVFTGPSPSRVDESRLEWGTPTGKFKWFEIR
jgi:acylphosphatase